MTMDSLWFHEEDYCQIELLPKAAENFARRQAGEIDTFSAAHDDGGQGWTDIYVRREPPASLGALRIALIDVENLIPPEFHRFDKVTTGYSTHVEPAAQTVAWQAGGGTVFVGHDDGGIVDAVWFSDVNLGMEELLLRLGARWPVVLAHWPWSRVVDLSDRGAVRAFLAEAA
jgi:hypothetical protein